MGSTIASSVITTGRLCYCGLSMTASRAISATIVTGRQNLTEQGPAALCMQQL